MLHVYAEGYGLIASGRSGEAGAAMNAAHERCRRAGVQPDMVWIIFDGDSGERVGSAWMPHQPSPGSTTASTKLGDPDERPGSEQS